MPSSDNLIDEPQRGCPKRAELPDVNINTGVQSINTARASLKLFSINQEVFTGMRMANKTKQLYFHQSKSHLMKVLCQFIPCGKNSAKTCTGMLRPGRTYSAPSKNSNSNKLDISNLCNTPSSSPALPPSKPQR